MNYPHILIRAGKEHILGFKHPWIFSQALKIDDSTKKNLTNGCTVDIYGSDGNKFFARGYYNGNSQIAFRTLTRDQNENINTEFFVKRFTELLHVRERFINTKNTNAFRIVFGESDNIPGLIIDKYNGIFVIQIHTLGMDLLRKEVIEAMKIALKPETIFERSDVGVRRLEGLADMPVGLIYGKKIPNEVEIKENSVRLLVNIEKGQKTGLFLDQRENRKALQKYCAGARVLNCFCYTAGFSVYAALGGATETINIDISKEALETAKRNFEINGISSKKHSFIDKDAFAVLDELERKKEKFNIVILDPPAFVKNQKSLKNGLNGYRFINERALHLLSDNGILISSSCSAHVTDEMFQKVLAIAATKAGCTLKTLEIRHQPIDHPFNVNFPEGKYLKFYVMLKG